jgi:hypothetical protein
MRGREEGYSGCVRCQALPVAWIASSFAFLAFPSLPFPTHFK